MYWSSVSHLLSSDMSLLQDLVMGQNACAPSGAAANPLQGLFSDLLAGLGKQENLSSAQPSQLPFRGQDKSKISARASALTRHVFPGECNAIHQPLQHIEYPRDQ